MLSACQANLATSTQSESVLIQKLFTHFKKTPGTHKLGVLYVVDSVTRKWLDQAKAQGQTPSLASPDGTFAAGVHRVTELIPILMNDIIATAPEDQKVRKDRTECHLISISSPRVRRAPERCPVTVDSGRAPVADLEALPRARLARVLRTCAFLILMNELRLTRMLPVGEDKEACRHLGEGTDLSCLHGQLVQGEAECSASYKYEYVLSPACRSQFPRRPIVFATRHGV